MNTLLSFRFRSVIRARRTPFFSAGFTIVEMLVVITIIGILALVVATNYGSVQASARDQVRMNDLDQIKLALSLYNQGNGNYPEASNNGEICSDSTVCAGINNISTIVRDYGGLAVADPQHGTGDFAYRYHYSQNCNADYEITTLTARTETDGASNFTEVASRCGELGGNPSDRVLILEFRSR